MDVVGFGAAALYLALVLSLPAVLAALLVGLIVGLLQALTQIQDQSVPFAIKMVAVFMVISMTAKWTGAQLQAYSTMIFEAIHTIQP